MLISAKIRECTIYAYLLFNFANMRILLAEAQLAVLLGGHMGGLCGKGGRLGGRCTQIFFEITVWNWAFLRKIDRRDEKINLKLQKMLKIYFQNYYFISFLLNGCSGWIGFSQCTLEIPRIKGGRCPLFWPDLVGRPLPPPPSKAPWNLMFMRAQYAGKYTLWFFSIFHCSFLQTWWKLCTSEQKWRGWPLFFTIFDGVLKSRDNIW